VHALVGFAELARVARVHSEAIGATVDLRSADLGQVAQLRIKPGLIDIRLECCNRLMGVWPLRDNRVDMERRLR
jgi:hypothetical protein